MANGCVEQRVSRDEFIRKSSDEKMICLWDVIAVMQEDVKKMKRFATTKIISSAFAGGALAIFALVLLGVKVAG